MFIPYGLLILGYFLSSVGASPAETKEAAAESDYDYNGDEDTGAGEMRAKTTHASSTAMPEFEVNETSVFYKPGNPLKLDCPVKHFDDSMMILWFLGNNTITNGKQPLSNLYKVANNFSLVMEQTTNQTAGSYFCKVMPPNVALRINVRQGEAPPTAAAPPAKEGEGKATAKPANSAPGVRLGRVLETALVGLLLLRNLWPAMSGF